MKSEVNTVSRQRVSITLPKECIDYLDKKIDKRTYANRSHAIEVLILEAMRKEKNE
jgi:metal-responsive CopG/Arc/MetJ family transcriptional regulator